MKTTTQTLEYSYAIGILQVQNHFTQSIRPLPVYAKLDLNLFILVFFLQIKNAELHSYTLLQHCGKDQTLKRIFNKNISLRLLSIQCRSVAFNAKKSFSRFLRPPNWRWKRRTSKPIFFIKPTWKLIEKCQIYRLNNNVILHIKGFMAFLFLTWNIVLLIMNRLLLSQN